MLIGGSALLASRNAATLYAVGRIQDGRAALASLLSAVEGAETGQRGYLLTDNESYLAPYTAGVRDTPVALDRLEAALRETSVSGMAAEMAALRRLVAEKFGEMARTVASARAGDKGAALSLVQSDLGQGYMRGIRRLVTAIELDQQAVLDERIATVNRDGQVLIAADILGFVLLAALAAAIAWGAWRAIRTLRRAQQELGGAYQALSVAHETLEDRVAERTAALTEANDEIQRFAYIVSHDLRAPLVNIMGFTSEMETAAATVRAFAARAAETDPQGTRDLVLAAEEDIPESIRFIKTSTAKMDRLISAILKLSREGRRLLSSEPVGMASLIQGIAASMQHQVEERGAAFVIEPMPNVTTDRLVLEQIFSNLMENALKYLKPGRPGRIVVRGRTSGPLAVFEVEDNGRGIADKDLERVFELFRRAGDQTVPGEGIGLAHVRALVRRLGGRIECVSQVDRGSTFRVEIPRSPGILAARTREQEHAEP